MIEIEVDHLYLVIDLTIGNHEVFGSRLDTLYIDRHCFREILDEPDKETGFYPCHCFREILDEPDRETGFYP